MKTIFKNCTLLDGTKDMAARENIDVAIENGKIVEIGSITPSVSDEVIDLSGKYLMPGLINLHVHLPAGGKPQNKPMKTTLLTKIALSSAISRELVLKMCHAYAMQGLMAGVTTVRAVGGLDNLDTRLRDKINSGKLDGPRILAANFAIGVPNGHMVGSVTRPAQSVADAVKMVDELKSQNVDLIKLMITGGVMDAKVKGEPGKLMMKADMIKACCDRAHGYGLKVAAHVQSPEGVRCAVENGVDSIEHGSTLTQREIDAFKKHNAVLVCTISPALPMAKFERETLGISEAVQYNSNIVYNNMILGSKTALENGITVGLGTDTGPIPPIIICGVNFIILKRTSAYRLLLRFIPPLLIMQKFWELMILQAVSRSASAPISSCQIQIRLMIFVRFLSRIWLFAEVKFIKSQRLKNTKNANTSLINIMIKISRLIWRLISRLLLIYNNFPLLQEAPVLCKMSLSNQRW